MFPVTDHVVKTPRHTSFYLECGAADATPIIFLHGWPELSISWRNQLPCFAALGFRAIAPDMRGYGRSTVHPRQEDYAMEHIVYDMIELLDSLGYEKAIWVGHDWGSPVAWGVASHHPDRCHGVASLCVPYLPGGFNARTAIDLVDRTVYPEAEFPAGQWEYQLFYQENFARAVAVWEADINATMKAMFRKGDPTGVGKPARSAFVRRDGGWAGGSDRIPDLAIDVDVVTESELSPYVAGLQRNGFFGPCSWYMNHEANAAYGATAVNGGRLDMPVLLVHAAYDHTCATLGTRLAEPMRENCSNLTERVARTGHWMQMEDPVAVNAAVAHWIAANFPGTWREEALP